MLKLKTQLLATIKKLTRTLAARALVRYCTRPITRELLTDLTQQLIKPKQKTKTKVLPRKLSGQKSSTHNSTTQTNETDSTKNKTENNLMNTNPNQDTKLQQIESATLEFALARQRLHTLVADLNAQIEQLKLARHATLHAATSELAQRQDELRGLLAASPELFVKPRTATFHGIKVGWQKGKGAIEFTDPDRVVTLIHRHYEAAEATALLHITERPDKEALAKLSVTLLRKLACTVTETGDQIIIRPMESESKTTPFPQPSPTPTATEQTDTLKAA